MGNMGRGIAIIVVVLTAWFFWPKPARPLGQLVVVDLRFESARDPAKALTLAFEPPVRLSNELLRDVVPLGPCASKSCGAVDPRSRAIMMGKNCTNEPDCRPFIVPELPDLYVLDRVFSGEDAQTLKREVEAHFVGRQLTNGGDAVMIRRILTVDVAR